MSQYPLSMGLYNIDMICSTGTVLIVDNKKISISRKHAETNLFGIVESQPTHNQIIVVHRGITQCKVIGSIKKGDPLVASVYPGYAEIYLKKDDPTLILGYALEDFIGLKGKIKIFVQIAMGALIVS